MKQVIAYIARHGEQHPHTAYVGVGYPFIEVDDFLNALRVVHQVEPSNVIVVPL